MACVFDDAGHRLGEAGLDMAGHRLGEAGLDLELRVGIKPRCVFALELMNHPNSTIESCISFS